MSERLRAVLRDYIIKYDYEGKEKLAKAVNRSVKTLNRWLKDGVPGSHEAYKLARQCGVGEEEALDLAKECSSEDARVGA
jgi:hypothetical protein